MRTANTGAETEEQLRSCHREALDQEKSVPAVERMMQNAECLKTESALSNDALKTDQTVDSPTEEAQMYLHGLELAALIVIIALGQFIQGLDMSIITTALPVITGEFHSLDDVGWIGLVYPLATMTTQPAWSKVFMFFNIKYTLVLAVVIFELGFVVCAIAHSSTVLIVGRAIAGVGQAALIAGGTIVITYRIPLERRAIYFAIFQSMNGIAAVIGPPLSGVFTDSQTLTWRFCFWINLPFGTILAIAIIYFQNPPRAEDEASLRQKMVNVDPIGTFLFMLIWVCIFMALERGGSTYPWGDSRVWGWFIGFALAMMVFLLVQQRQGDQAILPFSILKQRTVSFSCLYTCLITSAFSTFTYFLPFYFQAAKGASAEQSGIYLIPLLASVMLGCFVSSAVFIRLATLNPLLLFGAVIFTLGSGCITLLQVNSSMAMWIGLQILLGIGFGFTLQFALVAIQATLGPERAAIGSGLFFVSSFGGSTVGIGLAEVICISVLSQAITDQLPSLQPQAVISAGATGITSTVPQAEIEALRQIYCLAITRTFYLPTVMAALGCLCVLGIKWINLKKKP